MKTVMLLLTGLTFAGCTTTQMVAPYSADRPQKDSVNLAEVQYWIEGRSVDLVLTGGRAYSGENVLLTSDSLRWLDNEDQRQHAVPLRDVVKIELRSHFGGAMVGLFAGGAAGAATGWALERASTKGGGHPQMTGLGAVLLGAGGGVLGLIVGGIHGTVQVYQFQKEHGDSVIASPLGQGTHAE